MIETDKKRTYPARLLDALVDEWNERKSVGIIIPEELKEIISRHLRWAVIMGAESIIHKLQRTLELTPHHNGKLQYNYVMKLIQRTSPDESDDCFKTTPREYKLDLKPETIKET
jgi:hypothetical protein